MLSVATLLLLTQIAPEGRSSGRQAGDLRQPTKEEMSLEYKPDAHFDGVYIALVQRAWSRQLKMHIPAKLLRFENYEVFVKEEPTFYRVHFAPKAGNGRELGGVTCKGAEVMYIFDKKTLDFKYAIGAG